MDYQEASRIAIALEGLDRTLLSLLELQQNPLRECTTPKRIRNENARCGNCPYYSGFLPTHGYGVCCKDPATEENTPKMLEKAFCGQHPNFWVLPK